jgi:hypothetical protein
MRVTWIASNQLSVTLPICQQSYVPSGRGRDTSTKMALSHDTVRATCEEPQSRLPGIEPKQVWARVFTLRDLRIDRQASSGTLRVNGMAGWMSEGSSRFRRAEGSVRGDSLALINSRLVVPC